MAYGALDDMIWLSSLRSTPKLVLLRCACYAQRDGSGVFPSVPALASACSATLPTIRSAIADLVALGVLVLVAKEDPVTHRPREYRIDLDRLEAMIPPANRLPHPRKEFAPSPQNSCPTPPQEICPIPANGLRGEGNVVAFPPQNSFPIPANNLPHPRKNFAAEELKEEKLKAKLELKADGMEGTGASLTSVSAIIAAFEEARVVAFGEGARRTRPAATDEAVAAELIEAGADLHLCEHAFLTAQQRLADTGKPPIDALKWFSNRIKELVSAQAAGYPDVRLTAGGRATVSVAAAPAAPEPQFGRSSPAARQVWRMRLGGFAKSKTWLPSWGSPPNERGCEAPSDLIAEILPEPALL